MQQGCEIPCPECRILDPALEACPLCGGTGTVFQPARMADESVIAELAADRRHRVEAEGRTAGALLAVLVDLLVHGEAFAAAYAGCPARVLRERLRQEILDRRSSPGG